MSKIKTTFIIVDYNAGELIYKCVKSIFDNIVDTYEVIIFDNSSREDEKNILRKIENDFLGTRIIYSKKNIGFAKANNVAADMANGEVLHFLNPDTLVGSDLNQVLESVYNEKEAYVYGTSLYENKEIVGKEKSIKTIRNYVRKLQNKDWKFCIGASVIVKKNVFMCIGGWPEDYFMYMEDIDLFYTAARKGIQEKYIDVNIQHLGGGTTKKVWNEFEVDVRKEIAVIKFYKKYGLYIDYFVRRLVKLFKNIGSERGVLYNISVINSAFRSFKRVDK